ncbi:MAG: DUF1849 family protein [Rhodovibrionaceae bacterium]|nr:DUF1849 family protein [Rhodovibrionaceae bacterium]
MIERGRCGEPWPGRAVVLSLAMSGALAFGGAPAAAELLDHHAVYELTLEGAPPDSAEGRAEILVRRTCEQWNYVFFLDMTAGEGLDATHVELRQDFAEALNHSVMAFRTRLATGDTGASRVEGQVVFTDGENPAKVTVQRDQQAPRSAELPAETIGKVQSILGLTDALGQGAQRAEFTVFDTRALKARLVEVAAAAEPLPGPRDTVSAPPGQSWPLVMTLTDQQETDRRVLNLHESGVILWFRRSLGTGVEVTGQLIDLDLSERADCG